MNANKFLTELDQKILICDGGFGTQLRERIPNYVSCLDACNVEPDHSQIVQKIHREYKIAGADILQTNTYGANRKKLELHGFADQVREINLAGVELAREIVGDDPNYIAGSVGPIGLENFDEVISSKQIASIFTEQISALVEGGADLLILETFSNPAEAAIAVGTVVKFDLPIIFQMSGMSRGLLKDGTDVRIFAKTIAEMGVSVIGMNCRSPHDLLVALEKIGPIIDLPISVQPDAGTPQVDQGKIEIRYTIQPEIFGNYVKKLIQLGANIIGGCCGTTPQHTRKIRETIGETKPIKRQKRIFVLPEVRTTKKRSPTKNPIAEVFETRQKIVSVEMRANTFVQLSAMLRSAKILATIGVDLFDVPDNAGATVNIGTIGTAFRIQQETNIPTLIHWTTRQRNLISIQSHLLEAWALGLKGVIALSGDHPKVGRFENAKIVTDVRGSVQLIDLISRLNLGELIDGTSIGEACNFQVGAGMTIAENMKNHAKYLQRKVASGAKFVFTQPVFTIDDIERTHDAIRNIDVRVLYGILPITSFRSISFLQDKLGMYIPNEIIDRFSSADQSQTAQLGRDLTLELVAKMGDQNRVPIDGIYVIPPATINWKNKTAVITEIIKAYRGT